MAVSFAKGAMTLANWGFSVGDIATIAGAGRKVGNWIMAQMKDRAFIDFLMVDIDTIITRKAIVDTILLHNRWDRKITLLKNGRPFTIEHPGGSDKPVVDNVDRFTWLMMLIVAVLDSAVDNKTLLSILSDFLTSVFAESPVGTDYLRHEVHHHVQGWRSCACVRGILQKARNLWEKLCVAGKHEPGHIPVSDSTEIVRLFQWLVNGTDQYFRTAFSDVWSLAKCLEDVGIEISAVESADYDEISPRPYVLFDVNPITQVPSAVMKSWRCGIRVPLDFMEECVSAWPGDRGRNNELRRLFVMGAEAVGKDEATLKFNPDAMRPTYSIATKHTSKNRPRCEEDEYLFSRALLPKHCYTSGQTLFEIISSWDSDDVQGLRRFSKMYNFRESWFMFEHHVSNIAFSQLQAFVMGFYYRLATSILDTNMLSIAEVYGYWGYGDGTFFRCVAQLLYHQRERGKDWGTIDRSAVLVFVGLLFAGCSLDDLAIQINDRTVGIVSKLTVLTKACLGVISGPFDIGHLILLDSDSTALPSSSRGLIMSADSLVSRNPTRFVENHGSEVFDDASFQTLQSDRDDFTVHLEPDWDYDTQSLPLAYRHRGRIVHRLPPSNIEWSCINSAAKTVHLISESFSSEPSQTPPDVSIFRRSGMKDFQNNIVRAAQDGGGVIVSTVSCPLAQTCIQAMYAGFSLPQSCPRHLSDQYYHDIPVVISSSQDLSSAARLGYRYVLVAESMRDYENVWEDIELREYFIGLMRPKPDRREQITATARVMTRDMKPGRM